MTELKHEAIALIEGIPDDSPLLAQAVKNLRELAEMRRRLAQR